MNQDESRWILDEHRNEPAAIIFDRQADIAYLFSTAEEADWWLSERTKEPWRYATTINTCWVAERLPSTLPP